MTKFALPRLLLSGIALLLLNGCVRSEQPLSAAQEAKPDLRLVGTWHGEKEPDAKSDCRISFDAQGHGHFLGKAEDGSWKPAESAASFFVTRTEKSSYINALIPDDDNQPAGPAHYTFFRYTVADDGKTLHLWTTKLGTFQKAVRESKLKGRLDEAKDPGKPEDKSVLLQDSSDAILRFIEALPPDEAFTDESVSKRVD